MDELRPLTGRDPDVVRYVLDNEQGKIFFERLQGFLDDLLPMYGMEGRYRLAIALGCTGVETPLRRRGRDGYSTL